MGRPVEASGVNAESPSSGVSSAERAPAEGGTRDPLEQITDLDVAALESRAGVVRGTAADGVVRANDRFLELTGLSAIAARGWDWLLSVHGDDRDRLRRAIEAACRSGARSAFPIRARHGLDALMNLRVTVIGVPGPDGEHVFVASFEPDGALPPSATDPAHAADPFAVLVDALPVGVAYVAPDGTIDYANDAWCRVAGAEPGGRVESLDVAADPDLAAALAVGTPWTGLTRVGAADVLVAVSPIPADEGGGVVVTITDVEPVAEITPPAGATETGLRDAAAPEPPDDAVARQVAAFASLIDATPDYAAIVDPDGMLLHLNPAARRMAGVDLDVDVAGRDLRELLQFLDETEQTIEDAATEHMHRDGVMFVTGHVIRPDGAEIPADMLMFSITDTRGEHRATLCIARDQTSARAQADALTQSEAALRTVVGAAPVGIFAVDPDGSVSLWNPGCEQIFGWTADEVLGGDVPFITAEQRGEAVAAVRQMREGGVLRGAAEFARRDGASISVEIASAPVFDSSGRIRSLVTVAVDTTEQLEALRELELRADVEQLIASLARSLVDATPETVEGRVIDGLRRVAGQADAAAVWLYRHGESEPRYSWPLDAIPRAEPPRVPGAFVSDGADDIAVAGWVVGGADAPLGALMLGWPVAPGLTAEDLGPLETVSTVLIAALDRVQAELAVHDSELRFRTLAEHATDFVVVVDAEMGLEYLSPPASRFLGLTVQDKFDPDNPIVHHEDRDDAIGRMADIIAAPLGTSTEPFVIRLRGAEGEYVSFEVVATNLLDDPVVRGVVLNGRDVTARVAMEEQLRSSEREFRGLVTNLAEGVIVLAPDATVKYSSPSAGRIMGYSEGRTGSDLAALDFVIEEDRERVAEVVARAFSEPGIQGPVSLRVEAADGGIRWIEALGHNRLDDPDVEGVVVTARDITERVAAEEAARRSDARLSALVQNLSDVITIVDSSGEIVYTSPTAFRLFGFEEGDESYTDPVARMHPDDRDAATEQLAAHIEGSSQEPVRFRLRDAAGAWRTVEAVALDMSDDPDVGGIVITTRDVTDRMHAETLVADQAKVLTLIARGARLHDTLMSICDVLEHQVAGSVFGVILLDHATGALRFGAGPRIPSELANTIEAVACQPDHRQLRATSVITTAGERDTTGDWRTPAVRMEADRIGVASLWSTPILDSGSQRVIGIVVGCFDETHVATQAERDVVEMFARTAGIAVERQASEDLLAYRANHDALTGLPNRVLFLEFLSLAMGRSARGSTTLAVLFIDLDRFKHINDGLGHDAGDALLRQLAHRLRDLMRPSDVIARFGGDEFTVLCDGLDADRADEQMREIARRLLDVIETPLTVDDEDRRLSASIGIAIAAPDSSAEGLLRDADAAMYEAKQHGKARWEIFDDAMRSTMNARLDLESRLERAIERDELRLFLQPIVDLANGRCIGAEALLRWHDPEIGLITPNQFIGLAEETGLIIPVGEWALAEACRTVARWEEVGLLGADFTMAVNLSARQVAQADLVDRVAAVIERSGPMASRICLEITESVLMEESSVEAMHALKGLGVRLSIDDFGTGYSSLGYLKRFPVDSVKVDRSFVDGLGTEGEDSAIVAAVVSLGHALGLSVVAEGVETSGQLHELLRLGCDRAQGYWFSGPRSATEFAGLLHAQPWQGEPESWAS